ncbi:MAG: transglutaminase domain-containing protein [Planctomycetota bacterium]
MTLGLLELWAGSGGFVWSLGLVCLLVGVLPASGETPAARTLGTFRPGAYALALTLVGWVALHGALSIEAPPALVTAVRIAALLGLLTVPLTPTPAQALHALGLVLCAWGLCTLEPSPRPPALALGLLLLAGAAEGLRRTPSRRSAVSLAVVLLGLLPWSSGLELPRWTPSAQAAAPPRPAEPPPAPPASAESGVDPQRVWSTGEPALRSMRVIATVKAPRLERDVLLRAVALEQVHARGFALRAAPGGPAPECLQPVELTAEVELAEPVSGFLPCVGQPLRASVPHSALEPGLRPRDPPRYPFRYTVTGQHVHPRFVLAGRDPWPRSDLTELPPGFPPALDALLAEALGQHESPWRQALAISRWLQGRAQYADTAFEDPGLYARCLAFLTETRAGVCTEFAASLVVFLRRAGIPCRLVLGYRSDEREPDGTFVVRSLHAHAWVELPLEGAGWVPLDPTPGGTLPAAAPAPASPPAPPPVAPGLGASLASWAREHGRSLLSTLVALAHAGLIVRRVRLHLGDPQRGWQAPRHSAGDAPSLPERERWLRLLEERGYRVGGAETAAEFLARSGASPALRAGHALYERVRFGPPRPEAAAEFRRWLDSPAARDPDPRDRPQA